MKYIAVLATLVFLVSCSEAGPTNIPIATLNPAAIINPTLAAMYYGPDSATDGILSLEIENTEKECYSLKSRIPIKFTIRNLSKDAITFPVFKQDDIGFKPILTSRTVYIYYDPETPRDYVSPTMTDLVTLSGSQSYEGIYFYRLPPFLWLYMPSGDLQVSTPTVGEYLLKFVFENYSDYDVHAWTGRIASNQIKICVIE